MRGGSSAADGYLATLLHCLGEAQANDSGWPSFKGKCVEYPKFKKEWWAYQRTCHAHVRDELACWVLKDKSLTGEARAVEGDI
jgi:hypothetical protein